MGGGGVGCLAHQHYAAPDKLCQGLPVIYGVDEGLVRDLQASRTMRFCCAVTYALLILW